MEQALEPTLSSTDGWARLYIDLPGTGMSRAGEPHSDVVLEQVVETLDDRLGERRFAVAGWSYGGYLTAGLIRRLSDRVRGAMMICAGFKVRPADRDLTGALDSTPEPEWLTEVPAYLHSHLRHAVGHQTSEVGVRIAAALSANGPTDESYLAALRGDGFTLSDEDAPTKLDAPVCLLAGRRDRVAGYRDPCRGLAYLPQADYTVLASAGHYLAVEEPESFTALVHGWLRRCQP